MNNHKVTVKEFGDGTHALNLDINYIFIDKNKKRMDPITGTNRLKISKNGKLTRFIFTSRDFDIEWLIRKECLLKNMTEKIIKWRRLDETFKI